jgi:hypothetical protein
MSPLAAPARMLFKSALLIFVITILIGILNGLDIWDPPRNVLLTHVHAGTLGWITLAVVGVAMLMFGDNADAGVVEQSNRLAMVTVAAVVVYVIAFLTGTGVFRPIAGTLMLAAIVWVLTWVVGRYRVLPSTTPRLALLLAMISLTIGAILGVLLGLFIARGSIPGMSAESAAALAGAHPPAMLIGYLVLAGVAVADWILGGPEGRTGRLVAWALFVAGILVNIAFIFQLDDLIPLPTLLEVIAVVAFIVRMWPKIAPSAWAGGGNANFARMSIVFLAVGIGLLVAVVQLFLSGALDPETGEGPIGVLLAFDHAMFIGVMTNALFAAVTWMSASTYKKIVLWSVNGGLTVFLLGLVIDVAILKRIGAPVMGFALLYAIWVYFNELGAREVAAR